MGAKYGQHFLSNQHAAERIADCLQLSPDDDLIEIGPGKGTLTTFFLKVKRCVIIEVDGDMVSLLQKRFQTSPQIEIVHDDILEFDWAKLSSNNSAAPFKVVGNLPYNLTSPILRRLSDWPGWTFAVLMVQKEVGARLCAQPGSRDYGALTVGMNLTTTCEPIFDLSPSSFKPPPKVTSTVIRLKRRLAPLTDNIEGTQKVIQAAFQQRRKTLLNSLSHGLDLPKAQIQDRLLRCGIDPEIRPERLPAQSFIDIANQV